MSQMVETHGVLLSAVIKMIRHFEKETTPQAVANLAPNFLDIYSHSVFYNRTVQPRIHIAFAQ